MDMIFWFREKPTVRRVYGALTYLWSMNGGSDELQLQFDCVKHSIEH